MSNGQIEIHDPFTDNSRTSDEATTENSMEFRMLLAFTQRRRPGNMNNNGITDSPYVDVVDSANPTTKPTKIKKKKKVLSRLFSCVKPAKEEREEGDMKPVDTSGSFRSAGGLKNGSDGDDLEEVVSRIIEEADKIPFTAPELEVDSPAEDESVEKLIGIILREEGDRLNEGEEIKKLMQAIAAHISYSFFENLMETLLRKMGLWNEDPDASQKANIVVTCEVTSRLTAADTLSDRLLRYGATYLQKHLSPWAMTQGGYEEAFNSEDEEEVD